MRDHLRRLDRIPTPPPSSWTEADLDRDVSALYRLVDAHGLRIPADARQVEGWLRALAHAYPDELARYLREARTGDTHG